MGLRPKLKEPEELDRLQESAAISCRICQGDVVASLIARERMFGMEGEFSYVECLKCGCLQIQTIPADLSRYYSDAYYTRVGREGEWVGSYPSPILKEWSRFRLRKGGIPRLLSGRRYARFEWFRRTSTRLDDPILDVGCGSGRLLSRMARSGFSNLTGIDPDWEGPEEPVPGLSFRRAEPLSFAGQFQLVMAHHSFEHMLDPVRSFLAMAELLRPGGFLLLRTPRADCWPRGHYGADWVQLDAPRHLHLLAAESVAVLAEKAGLSLLHIHDDSGPFQIWGSEVYRRNRSLVEAGPGGREVLSMVERLQARRSARRLSRNRLGDQASYYFRRA